MKLILVDINQISKYLCPATFGLKLFDIIDNKLFIKYKLSTIKKENIGFKVLAYNYFAKFASKIIVHPVLPETKKSFKNMYIRYTVLVYNFSLQLEIFYETR